MRLGCVPYEWPAWMHRNPRYPHEGNQTSSQGAEDAATHSVQSLASQRITSSWMRRIITIKESTGNAFLLAETFLKVPQFLPEVVRIPRHKRASL